MDWYKLPDGYHHFDGFHLDGKSLTMKEMYYYGLLFYYLNQNEK